MPLQKVLRLLYKLAKCANAEVGPSISLTGSIIALGKVHVDNMSESMHRLSAIPAVERMLAVRPSNTRGPPIRRRP